MGGKQPVVHLLGILVGNGRVCKKPPVHDQRGQRNAKGLTESSWGMALCSSQTWNFLPGVFCTAEVSMV